MLFEQSSEISFIYLSSMKQKEKSNKTPTNMPVKEFYQKIAKTNNLYSPSQISKTIYVYVDSFLQTFVK